MPANDSHTGPAIHLANLVPASASPLVTPSIPLVQTLLVRSKLPIDAIALAVCILDSLDSKKFARRWRSSCPLVPDSSSSAAISAFSSSTLHRPSTSTSTSSSSTLYLPPSPSASPPTTSSPPCVRLLHSRLSSQTHIDSVQPEVIILAALVIANKFLEDPQDRTDYYCREWGQGLWSCPQLNATERCIIEELGWRIMPLCDPELLEDAKADMHFAAAYHVDNDEA